MRMRRSTRRLMFACSVLLAGMLMLGILNSNATIEVPTNKIESLPSLSNSSVDKTSKKLSLEQFTKDAEDQRERELATKAAAENLAKKKLQKEQSNECLFWKQQKKLGKAPNADEKIAKFCVL
jgi:DNA-directed RNA polymerase subunit M/transcription elongation factor TFIIS